MDNEKDKYELALAEKKKILQECQEKKRVKKLYGL